MARSGLVERLLTNWERSPRVCVNLKGVSDRVELLVA
jgi:hypothetical protein